MKVLSLFDGMAGGRIALDRLGVDLECYFASEIEPSSFKELHPDIIHLGNVTELDE